MASVTSVRGIWKHRIANVTPNIAPDVNNTPAFKISLLRTTCDQIFQKLCDVSDVMTDEYLQKLCTDLLLCSQEMIKHPSNSIGGSRSHQQSRSNKSRSHRSAPSRREMPRRVDSLRDSVAKRMANVVENEVASRVEIGRPLQRRVNEVSVHGSNSIFAKSPKDEGNFDMFLNIHGATNQDRQDYLAFKRSDANLPFILLLAASEGVFVVTGFVWTTNLNTYIKYPTALLSVIFILLAFFHFLWMALNRVVLLSFRYNIVSLQRYHEYVIKQYNSLYGQVPDNCTFVFSALAIGFYLVNITCMNLCDPEIMAYSVSSHAACGSRVVPPPESFVLTMVFIIVFQITVRGVSHIALVCSWVICIVSVNMAIYLSDGGSYVWMNLLLLLIMYVSYELERQPLRHYIKTRKSIEAGEIAALLQQQLSDLETLKATEALEAKRSLVRHIAHEIRTPLNVVGVGVDILRKELAPFASVLPEEVMDIVRGIEDASDASLEVINELLEFEKLAAGLTTLECVPTTILSFLEQAMKQHFLPARAKEILFELVPTLHVTRTVTIDVDPIKMATVFRNLFSNAIKFTKKHGRVTVRVDIKRLPLDDIEVLEISVQDSGAGLSPTSLSKLFREGVQFNANGLQGGGGSGLGLFVTKGIVQLHKNAKIWAESEGEGFGCTFFVHIPLHLHHYVERVLSLSSPDRSIHNPVGAAQLPAQQTELLITASRTVDADTDISEGKHSELGLSYRNIPMIRGRPLQSIVEDSAWKPTILVVDDSAMNRKMLVRMLLSKGFACCEAEDGLEALSEMTRIILRSTAPLIGIVSPLLNSILPDRTLPSVGSSSNIAGILPSDSSKVKQLFAIDAVLMDFNMPRMNGPDTIVEMRQMGFLGPIIGVSGDDEKTLDLFLRVGANNVIQKPVKVDKLVNMLLAGFATVIREATMLLDQPGTPRTIPVLVRGTAIERQEHITHLREFLEKQAIANKK